MLPINIARRIATLGLSFACLLAFAPNQAKAKQAAPDGEAISLIKSVQARYAKIDNFKAEFRQVVTRKHLPRPLKKQGVVYFKQPSMMRWDYTQPERVYYISDGEVMWTYEPSEKTAIKLRVKDSELYASLQFLFGKGAILESFNVTHRGVVQGRNVLDLVPKRSQSNYKKLTLHVDKQSFEIKATEITDPLDNVSRIEFTSASFTDLKSEAFRFNPPNGVTVEDMTLQQGGGS
jgi:outer membrane lipoprotein carrier protein